MMKSWLSIAATVAVVDGWMLWQGKDTLSAEYRAQAQAHPLFTALGTAYVVTHLWGLLPRKADIFYVFATVSSIPLKNRTPICSQEVSHDDNW